MKKLLLFLLTCLSFWAKAQQYPVDCRVSVLAPYSSNFSVYANDPQKFKVSLTLRDLARPSLEVTLRIRLKTAGFILENPLDFISQQSITLLPGITKTFTGRDLADNFSPVNLEGQGIDSYTLYRGEALPFGSYEWEVYAVESFRQRQVSNTGLATMHISSNYPPNLNLPSEGAVLTPNFPQNVNFTWSPRQVLASTSIVYTLYLYEIPEGEDALATVNSGAVPFRVVRSTTPYFNYGIQEPALSKGKQYAWQVQVQDFSEKERFENNGFSELRSFRYGQFPCANPMSLLSLPEADGAVRFSWEAVSQAQEYILSYNQLGSSESKSFRTEETSYQVVQLDPKSSYQWSVQSVCSFGDEGAKPSKQSFSFPVVSDSTTQESPLEAWLSNEQLSYDPDSLAQQVGENALSVEEIATETSPEQQLSDLLNTPITVVSSSTAPLTGESKALPEGVPSTLPTLPENPTTEQLQVALKSKKPTCNGINLPYICGNHDNVPKYSGSLISVNSGDEIAMNSMIISVVSIDGNGNGDGLIKVPMMGNVKLGLKLEGIKVAEGGCIVEGKANLSGVSLSVLNDKQREEMQKVYVAYKTAISIARENADVIAETINSLSELLENIKQDVSNYVGGVQDAKKMKMNFAGAEHYAEQLLANPSLPDSLRQELKAAYEDALTTKDFFCSGKLCQEASKKSGPFLEDYLPLPLCQENKVKLQRLADVMGKISELIPQKDFCKIITSANLPASYCKRATFLSPSGYPITIENYKNVAINTKGYLEMFELNTGEFYQVGANGYVDGEGTTVYKSLSPHEKDVFTGNGEDASFQVKVSSFPSHSPVELTTFVANARNLSLFNQIEVKEAVKTNTKSGQESSIHNKDLSFSEMGKKMLYILEGCSYTRPKDSGKAIKNYLYEDKNGNCTFGAGILLHNGGACTANDIIEWGDKSWADVESTLETKLSDFIKEVHKAIDGIEDFTITQTEFDAMVIFCYNIGPGGFKRSDFVTALYSKIRDGSLIFNYASKPGTNPVYQKRRFVEQTLFETGNYTWDGTKAITADTKIPCKK